MGIAAQMVGIAQGAFDVGYNYAMQRRQFGSVVGEFQGMQHQFAAAAADIEGARALTYNAARLKMAVDAAAAAGAPVDATQFIKAAAIAKLVAGQVAERTASRSIEWMGGMGFVRESGAEKYYRDAKIGAIYEGTSNIQLSTSALRRQRARSRGFCFFSLRAWPRPLCPPPPLTLSLPHPSRPPLRAVAKLLAKEYGHK